MAQKYYDTAVFGTTFLGLGAALQMENVVVIEKGGLFGAEFVNSYKVCAPKVVEPKTELGKEFLEDLKRRGLVSEKGEIYPAPSVYVLSSYLKEKSIDILLMTEVTDIKKVDNYYTIQTCYRAATDIDDESCKVLEDLKVKKLILSGNGAFVNDIYVQFYIMELYNADDNVAQIGVFDSLGNELIKPSSEYEILNEYESYSEESYPEAKFITYDNLIILKNKTTEKYHLLADNGVVEIMSLDVLKEYGLDEKNITNFEH